MTTLEIPKALHRGESELPFVALGDGTHLQLLQVDVEAGLWVVRTKFEPGVVVPTHRHTGEVFAFVVSLCRTSPVNELCRHTTIRMRTIRKC
jgi:anti-sigma factor ChrR (cupin superfamily)